MSEDTNLNNDLVLAEETKGIKTWVTTSVRGTRTYKFEGDPFPSHLTSDYILTYGASVLDPYDYTINQSANSITIDEPTLSNNLKLRLYYFGSSSNEDGELEGVRTWVTTSTAGTRVYRFSDGNFPSDDTSKYILTYGAAVLDPTDYYFNLSNNSIIIDEPTQTPGLKIRLYYFSGDNTTVSSIQNELTDIKNRLDTLESPEGTEPDLPQNPNDPDNEGDEVVPASTMTPSKMVTKRLVANEVVTNRFTLHNKTVFDITDDYTKEDTKTIPTTYALRKGLSSLSGDISSIKKQVDKLTLTPVLSDSIIQTHFQDENVYLNNFSYDLNRIIYGNGTENVTKEQASILIATEAFTKKGTYFVDFVVDKLPGDSTITVVNEKGEVVYTAIDPEEHRFELEIENPSTSYIQFFVNDVPAYDEVELSYLSVHHVKNEFTTYMDYAAEKILADGSSFVTVENYQQGLKDTIEKAQEYTNTSVGIVTDSLNDHTSNKDNPHDVTCEQIGAATSDHTHTPIEIGAADRVHIHTVDDVSGVAKEVHTHTPDECGAAPESHTHVVDDITDIADIITPIYDKIDEVEKTATSFSDEIEAVDKKINDHLIDEENPHGTTLRTLGYGIATEAEASDGVLEDVLMTPKTTKAVCASILSQIDSGVLPLEPTYIADITLDVNNDTLSVPIQKDKIYQLIVKGDATYLNNTKIFINDEDENLTYTTSYSMATSRSLTDSEGNAFTLNYTTWNNEIHPYFLFLGQNSGINKGNGIYTLDTKNLYMTGHGDGYITIDGSEINSTRYPFSSNSSANFSIIDMSELNLVFELDSTKLATTNGTMNIFIYEMVPLTHDPSMVVDATPIANLITRYGNSYIPGYSLLDGSELNKTNHLELFNYASENDLFISVADYTSEVDTNGYTSKFGYDEGNDTFFIPADKAPTDNLYRYIKISKTTIPNDTDILYRYVWN